MCIHLVVVYLIKKAIERKSLLEPCWQAWSFAVLPCPELSQKTKKKKKENSVNKNQKIKTVEIFEDKVRSSVPGAEGQELHQSNLHV